MLENPPWEAWRAGCSMVPQLTVMRSESRGLFGLMVLEGPVQDCCPPPFRPAARQHKCRAKPLTSGLGWNTGREGLGPPVSLKGAPQAPQGLPLRSYHLPQHRARDQASALRPWGVSRSTLWRAEPAATAGLRRCWRLGVRSALRERTWLRQGRPGRGAASVHAASSLCPLPSLSTLSLLGGQPPSLSCPTLCALSSSLGACLMPPRLV